MRAISLVLLSVVSTVWLASTVCLGREALSTTRPSDAPPATQPAPPPDAATWLQHVEDFKRRAAEAERQEAATTQRAAEAERHAHAAMEELRRQMADEEQRTAKLKEELRQAEEQNRELEETIHGSSPAQPTTTTAPAADH